MRLARNTRALAAGGFALTGAGLLLLRGARRSRGSALPLLPNGCPAGSTDNPPPSASSDAGAAARVPIVAERFRPGDEIVIPMAHVSAFGYYASRDPRLATTHPTWAFPDGPWDVAYAPPHRRHRWMHGPIPTPSGRSAWTRPPRSCRRSFSRIASAAQRRRVRGAMGRRASAR